MVVSINISQCTDKSMYSGFSSPLNFFFKGLFLEAAVIFLFLRNTALESTTSELLGSAGGKVVNLNRSRSRIDHVH